MAPTAAYDEIADWYEQEVIARQRASGGRPDADPLGIGRALRDLLGQGSGTCLDIGCGTGVPAGRVRELGWTPVGVDLSAGMLGHARGRHKVGASHRPLPELLQAFLAAGLTLERFTEGGVAHRIPRSWSASTAAWLWSMSLVAVTRVSRPDPASSRRWRSAASRSGSASSAW